MTIMRGAIDQVSVDNVAGWLYSEAGPLRGHTVLALIDDECVGAGTVDIFRPDLMDAGLGDGYSGFDIRIIVPRAGDEQRLVVKLDGSDLVLLQPSARISKPSKLSGLALFSLRSPKSLEWMRTRGWLEQMEIDLFRALHQFGIYDRSLRMAKSAEKASGTPLLDPEHEASVLFELLRMERVELQEHKLENVRALAAQRAQLAAQTPEPVVALWSAKREALMVVEGSHQDEQLIGNELSGAVDYVVGPDRLILLDVRCRFGNQSDSGATGLRTFLVAPEKSF